MPQVINLNLEQQDPKPAAIYILVLGDYLSVGCAYDTHVYTMKLFDRTYDNYFRYCAPCKFRRTGKCPGGEHYLFENVFQELNLHTPDGRHIRRSIRNLCLARQQGILKGLKKEAETLQVVKLPAYVLWNRQHHQGDFHWWILNPEASTIDEMWSGFPFPFANVSSSGQICMGDVPINDRFDFAEFQNKLLNGRYNADLRMYEPQFKTLGSYARALNAASNQVEFLNNFVASEYRNFAKKMILADSYSARLTKVKAIVPPIYNRIMWSSEDQILSLFDSDGNEFRLTDNEVNEVVA